MKKRSLILTFGAIVALYACETKEHAENNTPVEHLDHYVDSVKKLDAKLTSDNWSAIEKGYQTRLLEAEAANKSEKESKELEENKEEFKEFRSKYTSEPYIETSKSEEAEEKAESPKQKLRDALFGQGKIGSDMSFKWVTGENILSVYENFVSSVKTNKEGYSREDWDEVKVLYEALDTRKNEVEKELKSKDNLKIAKLKVEFATINTVNRPLSKISENEKAKEKGGK